MSSRMRSRRSRPKTPERAYKAKNKTKQKKELVLDELKTTKIELKETGLLGSQNNNEDYIINFEDNLEKLWNQVNIYTDKLHFNVKLSFKKRQDDYYAMMREYERLITFLNGFDEVYDLIPSGVRNEEGIVLLYKEYIRKIKWRLVETGIDISLPEKEVPLLQNSLNQVKDLKKQFYQTLNDFDLDSNTGEGRKYKKKK